MKHQIALIASVLLISVAGAARAGETKPNTLSQKEVSEGWILLFDGDTPFGWAPRTDAKWEVKDGVVSAVPGSGKGVLATTSEWGDFHLKADFWIDAKANSGIFVRCAPMVNGTPPDVTTENGYEVNIFDAHDKWPTGSINEVARVKGTPKTVGKWNTMEITAEGDHLVVQVNGKKAVDAHDAKFARGSIGLQYNGEGAIKFRSVKLQPLGLKSMFNGKNLDGWKLIPDHKSVFSVTPEGWLNVKNGNGDLQSEGQWGDFVFQMDIISNGDHLNSGVFFRALPGQFWSGYESQIRNEWMGNDRTKPVDFGTGAIYNRQAARRVISSDREWFTKTIVCHGAHMAVWVNGIQVSDFFDVRPPNENARQGFRAKPGVISLQGHDPTTDLSFRNIKIIELPKARQ